MSGKKTRTKWKPIPPETVLEQKRNPGNWEDEVAKEIDGNCHLNFLPKVELPTAPKASRASGIDDSKIPTIGPFQAYISNIPYELNEDELREVFQNLRVKSVRLPREEKTSKPKGFGYIEFEDRSSLSAALNLGDTMLKGRHIKIDLPNNSDMGRGRGGMRNTRDRDQGSSDRTTGNWRSGPRQDDFDDRNDRGYNRGYGDERRTGSSGFSRGGFDREDRSFPDRERGGGASSGSWRDDQPRGGFGRDGGRFNDREGGRFSDREGGSGRFTDREGGSGRFTDREGGSGRFTDREGGSGRFADRDGGGGRFSDRGGFEDRRESKFGPPPRRDDPPLDRGESRNRPKLQLQPRSKPKEVTPDNPSASASIFGGAKPVDTAAREREIEERLMRSDDFSEARSKGGPGSSGSREERRERQWESVERRSELTDKHVEPAPAPKENPWTKNRPAHVTVNNGRSSPDEDSSRIRSNVNLDDQNQDDLKSKRAIDENRGPRTSRGPAAAGPDRSRGKESERLLSKHRERKESVDDISKMPKLPESKTPNFAGSNKYSSLIDSDEAPNE